jgi:hypothetical protein
MGTTCVYVGVDSIAKLPIVNLFSASTHSRWVGKGIEVGFRIR